MHYVRVEWTTQAEGRAVDRGAAFLDKLSRRAVSLKPSGVADGHLHALLLKSLTRLRVARQQRLLAAETAISAVVRIVTLIGGGLTPTFGSFFGVPSLAMHASLIPIAPHPRAPMRQQNQFVRLPGFRLNSVDRACARL